MDAIAALIISNWTWVNNREAGDLKRQNAHCDVIIMNQPPNN